MGYSNSSRKTGVLILLLRLLMTTKPSLGITCAQMSLALRACARTLNSLIFLALSLTPLPTLACCESLSQIEELTTSIGINRPCVCVQAALAEIVPARIRHCISSRDLALCAANIHFNISGLPGECDA